MNDRRTRLDQELKTTMSRRRQLASPVAVGKLPPTIGDPRFFASQQLHESPVEQNREVGLAMREGLLEELPRFAVGEDGVRRSTEER